MSQQTLEKSSSEKDREDIRNFNSDYGLMMVFGGGEDKNEE